MLGDDQRQFAGGVLRKMKLRRDRPAAETPLDTLEAHILGRHLPSLRQTAGLADRQPATKDDHRRQTKPEQRALFPSVHGSCRRDPALRFKSCHSPRVPYVGLTASD